MITVLYLAVLLLLLGLSAFFSGAETAIMSITHPKIHRLIKEGKHGAKSLKRMKRDIRKTVIVLLIGNNIVNIMLSSISTIVAVELLGSVGIGIAIGIIFLLILTFGEILPKTIATVQNEKIALYAAPVVEVMGVALSPIVFLVYMISNSIPHTRKGFDKTIVTEREMHELMELGVEEKVLEREEVGMIKKVLLFNDITVKEIMFPIENVIKIDSEETVENAIRLVANHSYTRYPLIDKKSGQIVGSLKIKRLFAHAYEGKEKKVSELADRPLMMTEEMKIDDAFAVMKKEHRHIAYIQDKSGRVNGMITLEDVLEELVGEF